MLYILLIVLAFITHNPIPVYIGIALFLFATWEPESAYDKSRRRLAAASRRARKRRK